MVRVLSLFAMLIIGPIAAARCGAETIDFDRDIRPLFSDRCYKCHGPDEAARQAELRLDEEDSAKETVIEPGDAESSELYQRISANDPDYRMPPPESKLALGADEVALIRKWINEGATWKQHWAFIPPQAATVPEVDDPLWATSPIDAFVAAKLSVAGLQPSQAANRETIIRRLSFAITGLPPTPEEVDEFLADPSPQAYEKVVDRLLRSVRFGERMAANWLDVARYSDTYGYQVDRDRFVWPYRDWVIQAFNKNLPYDQFLTEQLAGDLLPSATDEQILATTFNRLHPQECEGGSLPEEFRMKAVSDRTETVATAFLGITLECCRCHDHKFDPLTQREYYQLSAFFDNIDEEGLYPFFTDAVPTPTLLLPTDEQRTKTTKLVGEIQQMERALQSLRETRLAPFQEWLNAGGLTETALDPVLHLDFESPPEEPNQQVPGRVGSAVQLTGDHGIVTEVGNFHRYQPFSVALWLQTPDVKQRSVVFHRSRAWTDAGSRGYELLIQDGRLQFALIHVWPGNAIAIRTRETIPIGKWLHVVVTNDGSSRADGLRLFLNGQPAEIEVVRDNLIKDITGGGGDTITIGERFRDRGFTDGQIDEFRVFRRQLTAIEARQLAGELSLDEPLSETADAPNRQELFDHYLATQDPKFKQQQHRLMELRQQHSELLDATAEIMVMRELPSPRPSYLLQRGSYDALGEPVQPLPPAVLGPMSAKLPANRLGLADWLTRPDHPLTARVQVNRVWQMLFGAGLVRTPEDFGRQGAPPTHPEVLDWLAVDFVENGWNIKRLIKQIVMTNTYRQSSLASADLLQRDPDNRLLARGSSFRLPAEMLRDNAMFVSGLLVERFGGAPVKPYDLEEAFSPVDRDQGAGLYRRSLYTYWKRTGPAPVMTTFDASLRDVCRMRRERTSTPLQALVLLNSPQFVEASRALAQRVLEHHGDDTAAAIREVFRRLTIRSASVKEVAVLAKLYDREWNYFREHPQETERFLKVGDFHASDAMDRPRLAAMASVAGALFSYDEVQMVR